MATLAMGAGAKFTGLLLSLRLHFMGRAYGRYA